MHPSARQPGIGFTLLELLMVIAVIALLASLLTPALGKAKRRARLIEEMSSARQLILAMQMYGDDHTDALFPGYASDPNAVDDRGQSLGFPVNARYPWRISPYLGQSFDTIYCGDNRAQLSRLRRLDRASYVYAVSVSPSLGINSYFVGGNETEFPAALANERFGCGTVAVKFTNVRSPSDLMAFVSARSAMTGLEGNGYFQVTPPFLNRRLWAPDWSPGKPPKDWGFVAPRHERRAVGAMLDGHAQSLSLKELQDMRRWCNTADRPDFTLPPNTSLP